MYKTAEDIDSYFTGEKLYYMRHTSAGATPIKMNLADYRGKMGRLVDAESLLLAIDGSGRETRLPNIYLAPGQSTTISLADYSIVKFSAVEVVDPSIASVVPNFDDNTIVITAKSVGQTEFAVIAPNNKQTAIITVREGASDNGWL